MTKVNLDGCLVKCTQCDHHSRFDHTNDGENGTCPDCSGDTRVYLGTRPTSQTNIKSLFQKHTSILTPVQGAAIAFSAAAIYEKVT